MPKFIMLVSISGTRDGQDWPGVGGEIELPEVEGAKLVRAGLARSAAAPVEVETTRAPKPETAARKPGRKSVKAATAPAPASDDKE